RLSIETPGVFWRRNRVTSSRDNVRVNGFTLAAPIPSVRADCAAIAALSLCSTRRGARKNPATAYSATAASATTAIITSFRVIALRSVPAEDLRRGEFKARPVRSSGTGQAHEIPGLAAWHEI